MDRRAIRDIDRRRIHRYAKAYNLTIIRLSVEKWVKSFKRSKWEVVFYAKTPDGHDVRITEVIWSKMTRYTTKQYINPNEYYKEVIMDKLGMELIIDDDAPPLKMRDKVTIRCPIHGDYQVTLKVPYYWGHGCKKCSIERFKERLRNKA